MGQRKQNKTKLQTSRTSTDNFQLRSVVALSGTVCRYASIVPGVVRPDSLNGQYADPLTVLRHHDTFIRRKFGSPEQPVESDREIALGDRALHGSHVGLVERFFAKFEG